MPKDNQISHSREQIRGIAYAQSATEARMDFSSVRPAAVFLTFNTHKRQKLLANGKVHNQFVKFVIEGEQRGVCIGRYVIMPDHIHLFVRGSPDFLLTQ